ncbi:MAG TPA: 4-hydroxy-3-methylbut-2-enyl diphosphate reductase [Candidatus Coprenecus stercoravium]|uniref:4-hydroxy-3-methylbut-2-enyl diphosphate reductase n=1 Tax=Candidatus Coprenecus stercoravium TaxID=2840735 RepID=A0A9D2GPZ4_9BACT|nr:4-hydroxy-3-methylbut-2-enyl diphosphate reductase [Candidatus Coprenecus stercoravium]
MKVVIDGHSGCCNGVRKAISAAEDYLDAHGKLYSLGAIVHNDAEIHRLEAKGLRTIGYSDFPALKGSAVLIRAHGEPPSTYRLAEQSGVKLIDCTCPVVLALQKKIAAEYHKLAGEGGQVVIFGKSGHAEVNGLVGQTEGHAVVVENMADLERCLASGAVDPSRPLALFSQTTKDPEEFSALAVRLRQEAPALEVFDTICRNVSSRHSALREFAAACSVIVFVCGRESSNGKVLFELCRCVNPRSYKIECADGLPSGIFRPDDVVGVCGATSTTRWQLEDVAAAISRL